MSDVSSLRERYLEAQLKGDRREALRVVIDEGLDAGLSARELHALVRDAQHEIGRLWQEDRITIAQEHMATAISQLVLSHVYDKAVRAAPNGKRVLVACVEGELHEFPARLVADALDLAGFEVRYVGSNVPTDSLLRTLTHEPYDLLVLSSTMTFHLPALREAVARVREEHPRVPIAVGGAACEWASRVAIDIGADLTGGSAEELLEGVRALLGGRR